ncbi:hypothetical protein M9458_020506, partial [Cirrhinus mrigala]
YEDPFEPYPADRKWTAVLRRPRLRGGKGTHSNKRRRSSSTRSAKSATSSCTPPRRPRVKQLNNGELPAASVSSAPASLHSLSSGGSQ